MDQSTTTLVNTYLARVRKNTPRALRAKLQDELQSSIYGYCEANPVDSIETLYQVFGTPEIYVAEYMSLLDANAMKESLHRQKRHHRLFVGLFILLFLLSVVSSVWIMTEGDRHKGYYYEIETKEIP